MAETRELGRPEQKLWRARSGSRAVLWRPLLRAVTTTGAGGAAHRGPGVKGPLTAIKILR